jgi:nitrate/nitrite transport system ATP-binding protein
VLGPAFEVTLPRPRNRAALNHDDTFKRLRAAITEHLSRSMSAAREAAEEEEDRTLPNVVPITQQPRPPKAWEEASASPIEERYLELFKLQKVYPTPKGPLTVVEDINLIMKKGEFVSLIGHSGCGKSTVLSMVAGLTPITGGGAVLGGREIDDAGPDRAVGFQAPSLLPWATARDNVALGVDQVYPRASPKERAEIVEYYLARVGLADAMDKRASELSGGMKQRVGIARAFALSPKLLLLDEPFGMLDSLTRWELQDVLMEVWRRTQVTAICVTHDVDEAILLADRVVMMTNGPRARIGKVLQVDLPRPRTRKMLLEHPRSYAYREELLSFLEEYEHGGGTRAA